MARADNAADAVEAAIRRGWNDVLTVLGGRHPVLTVHRHVLAALRRMHLASGESLAGDFKRLASWGYTTTAADLTTTLPVEYLRAAVVAKGARPHAGRTRQPVREEVRDKIRGEGVTHGVSQRLATTGGTQDRHGRGPVAGLPASHQRHTVDRDSIVGAIIEVASPPPGSIGSDDPSDPTRDFFANLLFPPPTAHQIAHLMGHPRQGVPWVQQLAQATSLAPPERLATALTAGYAAGEAQADIARRVLPAVNNYRVAARRIARTEGLRIAHAGQMEAHAQVDDLVAGYQIRATLDQNTRPEHAARNGLVWYKKSRRSMQETLKMAGPTLPDGHNCRCMLMPVMQQLDAIEEHPAFRDLTGPDPSIYSQWFDQADERHRRIAVGSRRYSLMADKLGHAPRWEHFISREGELLPIDRLKREGVVSQTKRVERIRKDMDRRKELVRRVSAMGFA